METLIIVVVVIFIALGFFGTANKGKTKGKRTPIKAKRVLTMNEQPTFNRLREALPEHFVLAQVSFGALLNTTGQATRNRFNRKIADFVVLDKSFNVVAVVELDDSSHKGHEDKDADRDAMLQEAGYRVIRYKHTPDLDTVKADFGITPLPDAPVAKILPQEKEFGKTQLISEGLTIERDQPPQR